MHKQVQRRFVHALVSGEGKCSAHETSQTLAPGAVPAFDYPSLQGSACRCWFGQVEVAGRRVFHARAGVVTRAFERAVRSHRPAGGLLRRHETVPSMRRPANCDDNARMESFWATMKTERNGPRVFTTRADAKTARFAYLEIFYNRRRLHGALGFPSPVDYENNLS